MSKLALGMLSVYPRGVAPKSRAVQCSRAGGVEEVDHREAASGVGRSIRAP